MTNLLDLKEYKTKEQMLKEQDKEKRKWRLYKSLGHKPNTKFIDKISNLRYERARLYRNKTK